MGTLFVGIDVSTTQLHVHLRPGGDVFSVSRDAAGLEALIARLTPLGIGLIGVATGGLETVVAAGLAAAGLPVVMVNPAQVRSFADSIGTRPETDAIDSALIAHFLDATRPEIRPLPNADPRMFPDPIAWRKRIVEIIGAEQQLERRATAFPDGTDMLQALAERRLRKIAETLGLAPDHFERTHRAVQRAPDGVHDQILADQGRQVAEALPKISDAFVRARVVGLVAALAGGEREPNA